MRSRAYLFALHADMAILISGTRARISAVPCKKKNYHGKRETLYLGLSWSQTCFLSPALPLICPLTLGKSLRPPWNLSHSHCVSSLVQIHYGWVDLPSITWQRSLYSRHKNSRKGATLHHVFLPFLVHRSADLLQIINSHWIAYLSTSSGSGKDKIIYLQEPSLAASLLGLICCIYNRQDLVC